ncbi:MAG TPA: hypothetical protein VD997_15170 [Phycisphaerales bacterium]|nr:hypothetical protein [Phycisphaerales bacterium]
MPDAKGRVWCSRCKRHVGVFDDTEHERFRALYVEGVQAVKAFRERTGAPLSEVSFKTLFAPMYRAYAEFGGDSEVIAEEVLKHQRGRFGPPCATCGLELQSSRANWCIGCGARRKR